MNIASISSTFFDIVYTHNPWLTYQFSLKVYIVSPDMEPTISKTDATMLSSTHTMLYTIMALFSCSGGRIRFHRGMRRRHDMYTTKMGKEASCWEFSRNLRDFWGSVDMPDGNCQILDHSGAKYKWVG